VRCKRDSKPSTACDFVAYFRVGTKKQSLGLDAQRDVVERFIAQEGGILLLPPYAQQESGTSHQNRIEWHKALAKAKDNGAVLCIAKPDRLARDLAFIGQLRERARRANHTGV
jgi:DNA invertase Pin-like site-specific DNA recombinase